MLGIIKRPKVLALLILAIILFVLSLAGGALGKEFGFGFLGTPLPHIQLPAEPISASPLIGSFRITNTMVASWAAILVLTLLSYFGTRQAKEIPGRLQGFLELVLELFLTLSERVAGPEKARIFLPLVVTIFLFVVTANWMGILPGYGTVGRFEPAKTVIHHAEEKSHAKGKSGDHDSGYLDKTKIQIFENAGPIKVQNPGSVGTEITARVYLEPEENGLQSGQSGGLLVPFLRSANTDINTTLGIALISMFMVQFWGFRRLGIFGHLGKFINFTNGPIGFFVGILEGISEFARIISFTFRLFGNIFAGEVLLMAMAFLLPLIGLIPFLGLELFVGLIQGLIFAVLTLVFSAMATVEHSEDH